ncbi:MAG: hypothetical protein EOO68_22090 [Moraxellaceae bacterium]|nr:MAG: hypothetical protein EOO68_22090 [Moraxellaceae bacterium]
MPREDFATISIPEINAGVPADVITRRPDVASVEAQLHAASADVHVARTQLLPGLQLSGSVGKSGSQLFSLNPAVQSTAWSLSAAQTLFAGGRISNQVKLSKSRQVEMLEEYRKTILNALLEVDDALNRVAVAQQQEINQNEIVVQSERSLKLVEARYRAGDGDLLSLLDSQRTLFQSRDSLVQQRLNRIQSAVDLYKALGGGWRVD